MTYKRKIDSSYEEVEARYANWLKQVVDLVGPKNLYLYLGRASGKTTDIIAERSMEIVWDMPGAYFALVGDTYMNLQKNVVPSMLEGWTRKGWIEGIHYVVDQRPPAHFQKPYKSLQSAFKHTIITWNGCVFKLVSMDRPSTGAGDSYQHLFGDEAKYLKESKLNKLTPAIRGESVRFHKSPYYRGHTFTSDMANPLHGEDDWMWKQLSKMDKERIELVLQTANVVNDIRKEIFHIKRENKPHKLALAQAKLKRWEERYRVVRKNTTFFYTASSFVNTDVLTAEFFTDMFESMDIEEVLVSVLSIKPTLEKGQRFYANLQHKHFYRDGIKYDHYDQIKLGQTVVESCLGLKYLDPTKPIEAGMDFGNMMSMVTGQTQGTTIRALKSFFTLSPEWIPHIADKFTEFYKDHPTKQLELYYDRAANNFSKAKQDYATQIKQAIETKDGVATGWYVKLMSRNQGNISQEEEYDLMVKMMGGLVKGLPEIQIDEFNNKELKSSLELAPIEITHRGDVRIIKKVKKSEKLPLKLLPMRSTNFSDAFKYFICRPNWLKLAKNGGWKESAISDIKFY